MDEQRRRDRVLVVDDSPETLSFLTDALEAAGITALVATGGEAALALVRQITPDLILMDANMPGIDGFETTRRLGKDFATWHVPIIFMTGLTETEYVVQGLTAGAIDYIAKPIVLEELLARVRVHLASARIAQGARSALDATGRSLLAIDEDGRILWSTPQAGQRLAELFAAGEDRQAVLPPSLIGKLARLRLDRQNAGSFSIDFAARRVSFNYLSRIGPDEFLYRLVEDQPGAREAILRATFGVTGREAEVLVWIAAGKSNRDIGDILGISPRTVNKHLEQIFEKLGVENRATAAAMAVNALADQN
ncbi:DNA-binding response regulator [Methylovirgula sp. HY1]|uniref:response regulator transcription factor n=1 Tax=Methylovirgula sp. HY1 TaxID=2822761 RepID=UPI001C5B94A8|nr:DNA-binding response regulator [Methylovirgula sp. HY1]